MNETDIALLSKSEKKELIRKLLKENKQLKQHIKNMKTPCDTCKNKGKLTDDVCYACITGGYNLYEPKGKDK